MESEEPFVFLRMSSKISVSEADYNPVGGSEYEFVELVNLGPTPFDLSGAQAWPVHDCKMQQVVFVFEPGSHP